MKRKEFIKLLEKETDENISVSDSYETAHRAAFDEVGDCDTFTPELHSIGGRLIITFGTQETG